LVGETKLRAPRNRTINLSESEHLRYKNRLSHLRGPVTLNEIINKTICQDIFNIIDWLPAHSIDLVFADPPYNISKKFGEHSFSKISLNDYEGWLLSWIPKLVRILKPTSSIYICADWRSSSVVHRVMDKYFIVRNRITWEREKGRGARKNWKNCSEDIWYGTLSENYVFNIDDVKQKRRVIAPYTNGDGTPKDWEETEKGRFRITHPSNIWMDITVPFWSMPENSDHPTQKPEKLLAKIIMASSNEGDVVFDPFLGSGTTSVVAKKLNRRYIGIEIDETYCCIAEKRIDLADSDTRIQGFLDGYFWERNTLSNLMNPKNNQLKVLSVGNDQLSMLKSSE